MLSQQPNQKSPRGSGVFATLGGLIAMIFLAALTAFVIGLALVLHYHSQQALCASPLGQLDQQFNSQMQATCSSVSDKYILGWVLLSIGAPIGIWSGRGTALLMLGASNAWSRSSAAPHRSPQFTTANPLQQSGPPAPRPVPALPALAWAGVLAAAAAQPAPRSQRLEAAIRQESWREDLRSWLFGTGPNDSTYLLLLFDSKLMTLECWDNSRGTLTAYDQSRLPIRTRRDATGSVTEIEVSGKRLRDLQPPNAVANFVGVAMQLPWIQLITERGLVESGPPTASASPAQPSASQAGDHAMISWPPPTVVATTSPTVPVTSDIPPGAPEAPLATGLVPTPPPTADNKPDSGPVSSSPLAPQAQPAGALREELRLLKSLRDEDLIDDAEYAKRKAAVLDRWTTGEP